MVTLIRARYFHFHRFIPQFIISGLISFMVILTIFKMNVKYQNININQGQNDEVESL